MLENNVAVAMAKRVIDFFEAVQINEEQGGRGVCSRGAAERMLETHRQQLTVRQAGQCIVESQTLQFRRTPGTFQCK